MTTKSWKSYSEPRWPEEGVGGGRDWRNRRSSSRRIQFGNLIAIRVVVLTNISHNKTNKCALILKLYFHTNFFHKSDMFPSLLVILLVPSALQPTVGFDLPSNVLPFFFLSATNSLHLLTLSTWRSLSTSSFHLFLGLPVLLLVPSSSSVKIFFGHPLLLHSL